MSYVRIKSGAGNGKDAYVTTDNQLQVASRMETQEAHETELGNAYNINPGTINLTSANASALLYLKNTGDNPLKITTSITLLGTSTNGSGDWQVEVLRNPTAGTLLSGTAYVPLNKNFGSANTLTGTALYGAEASTVTASDGTIIDSLYSSSGRKTVPVSLELPKGTSVAVRVTPPTGNTSANVQVALAVFERSVDV